MDSGGRKFVDVKQMDIPVINHDNFTMATIEQLCSELNIYLSDRYGYKRPVTRHQLTTISAREKYFDLYIRYRPKVPWAEETLVISRMFFFKERAGNGTSLLKFFISQSQRFGFTKIGIEQANANASAFAQALAFEPVDAINNDNNAVMSTLGLTFTPDKNWISSIDALRSRLQM